MAYITLNPENIASEHICCAFSDKKCWESYEKKKQWLKKEFANGYIFRRLDQRAKVFIEYGPAEKAWVPVTAPNFIMTGCFWVSGKYKGTGHGKALLAETVKAAKKQNKDGLAAIVGRKKFHFLTDGKWLIKQGFEVCDSTPAGFDLLVMPFHSTKDKPRFNPCTQVEEISEKNGCVVYYSNRCPYSEYHVENSLTETCEKRGIPLKIIKIKTMEEAQACPSPATIFSLFLNGKFITTDISTCMDSRFDKVVKI